MATNISKKKSKSKKKKGSRKPDSPIVLSSLSINTRAFGVNPAVIPQGGLPLAPVKPEAKKMFSVMCKFQDLPQNVKVSARSVENVDLSSQGGYALLGSFASNYDGSGLLTARSLHPLVVMLTFQYGDEFIKRFAVVVLPVNDKTSVEMLIADATEITSSDPPFKGEIKVSGPGLIFGVYTERDRQIVSGEKYVNHVQSRNVYYQVALDLYSLSQAGLVDFNSNSGVILSHNELTTIHGDLPSLPRGYRWGPEIGGIVTIQKVSDPTEVFFVDVLAGNIEGLSDNQRAELLDFIRSQSTLLANLSRTYEVISKVYK